MNLRVSTWNYLKEQWHRPISLGGDNPTCHIKLAQVGLNALHKTMVAIAALVALVATPILVLIDLCSSSTKPSAIVPLKVTAAPMGAISILDFYQGSRNDRGVTLEEIWKWDDSRLEDKHDFIQWLFPTKQRGMNPTAALTDDTVIAAFKKDKTLQEKMVHSFDLMLKFYGLTRSADNQIQVGSNFNERANNWIHLGNHNYLRVTRILKSLRLHGLDPYAKAFFEVLKQIYQTHSNEIGAETFSFWQSALK